MVNRVYYHSVMKRIPNIARSLMVASRAHVTAVMTRLAARGYGDFPFASASLLWLMDESGTRSTVLAQRAGVTKQAMSQLVKQMERQGYLEQAPDAVDTRAKVVRMTARGQAVKQACEDVRDDLNRKLEGTLKASEARRMEVALIEAAALFTSLSAKDKR